MKRTVKPKPKSKRDCHRILCDDLYNRLQQGVASEDAVIKFLCEIAECDSKASLVGAIMMQSSCTIKTYQINAGRGPTFEVAISYEDRSAEPLYGALYPSMYAINISQILSVGVILCYLAVSKQLGRFYI